MPEEELRVRAVRALQAAAPDVVVGADVDEPALAPDKAFYLCVCVCVCVCV